MLKKLLLTALGLLTILAITACGDIEETNNTTNTQQPPRETLKKEMVTYKIGVITPLSGDASALGGEAKKALDYKQNEINADAEKNGYKIELVYEDGKCEGGASATAFQKLADVDGVKFIIGGSCSSETMGFAPLLTQKNILAIAPHSSNPALEGMSPNLHSLSYNDEKVGEGLAKELGKYKKIALLTEQNDWNQGIKKVVEKKLAEQFPETAIVTNEEFPKGTAEFRNILDKIKASGAEAVLLNPNIGVTSQSLIKQLAEIKDWNAQLVSIYAYLGKDSLAAAPETAEGMVIIDVPNVTNPDFKAYADKIVAVSGTLDNLGPYYTATALDALNLYNMLLPKYNGDVEKVKSALNTETFDGWIGKIKFEGKTFVQGINAARFVVKDGEAQPS